MNPFFSVIVPSFVGDYKNAAKDRENKLIRAIESILRQTCQDFEIIVIADGCDRTFQIICERYEKQNNVNCVLIKKQPLWTGVARQFGVTKAEGSWMVYLDSDDEWGANHLQTIKDNVGTYDWVYFNDYAKDKIGDIHERQCNIGQKYHYGTSNFAHKKECIITWGNGYGLDDFHAVQTLIRNNPNYAKIPTPEYYVCHIPAYRIDV